MRIDLNSDLGEGFGPWRMGDDDALLDVVTTANIACGFHAGDPQIMRRTVATAREKGAAVGAHPGFYDLIGFGRRRLPGVSEEEIENLVAYQVGAFQAICALAGHPMTHVKTHGALGNMCAEDSELALAVARGIKAASPGMAFMVMPAAATEQAAAQVGLPIIREVYADRTYDDAFNLTGRNQPGAVIDDPQTAVQRAVRMIRKGEITAASGRTMAARIDSICVHGDSPAALEISRKLRAGLEQAGIRVAPYTAP